MVLGAYLVILRLVSVGEASIFFNEVILTFLRQKSKVTVLKIINEIRKRWKLSLRTKLKKACGRDFQ